MPTVMITGVNRGLGLEFARQYAGAGWTVVGTCRDPQHSPDAQMLADQYENLTLYPLDVTDAGAIATLGATLQDVAIDVLILNAGVMGERTGLGTLDAVEFLHVMNVNVVAPAMLLQAFAGHVAASQRKIIVGLGSILGSIG
ncbi:MAG: SDR family NAD(P)-dependent oxidoreductase, partial [Congregibacter sp.]|nr:SDR family NAD(P)-dependent oxidoreductase [Congregibacter sp.]